MMFQAFAMRSRWTRVMFLIASVDAASSSATATISMTCLFGALDGSVFAIVCLPPFSVDGLEWYLVLLRGRREEIRGRSRWSERDERWRRCDRRRHGSRGRGADGGRDEGDHAGCGHPSALLVLGHHHAVRLAFLDDLRLGGQHDLPVAALSPELPDGGPDAREHGRGGGPGDRGGGLDGPWLIGLRHEGG